MAEKYLMVNLGDDKSRDIAEILGNKTCIKILELLSNEELSEGDIARKLNIPINTADYNVKKLEKSGLIKKANQFFWSSKGKKIPVYKVSNKKILISPSKQNENSVKNIGMKFILPIVLISGAVALGIRMFNKIYLKPDIIREPVFDSAETGVLSGGRQALEETGKIGIENSDVLINISSISPWMWFLIGAWFAALLFFIICFISQSF